ncbi:MAG: ABC transporter ATP-binding protein [Clostridia bacterium]
MSAKIKKQGHRPAQGGPMGLAQGAEKAENFKSGFVRLIQYLRPQLLPIVAMLILSVGSMVLSLMGPRMLGGITNELQNGIRLGSLDMDSIINTAIKVVALYGSAAVLNMAMYFTSAGVAQKVIYRMRRDVKLKLSRLPIKYFDENPTGDILSRVTNDVDTIYNTLQQGLTEALYSAASVVGILIMMLTISGYLSLITLGTLPLFVLVTVVIAKKSQKRFSAQQKELGELNGYIEEVFTGQKIVKLYGTEKESEVAFTKINHKLYNSGRIAQFLSGIIMPLLRFISNVGYVGVCVVGGLLAGNGRLGIGDIQAFIQYSNQFAQPVMQTANIANVFQSTIAAAERVFSLLDAEEEVADAQTTISVDELPAAVTFEEVDFSYSPHIDLIKDMNISVPQGARIAIVGPTGAGKTTMVNLLLRFYEINAGKILIGGEDIADMKRKDLRGLFGMVLQDTWLFAGTIRENIAYGRPDATEEEVLQAAKDAHVDYFISTLPDGYDTVLNEEASNISQGQKQLLTIARAILRNPKILILDEATSSVDTRTEAYIQNAMTAMMKEKTSFIIAHRLSTIKTADLILVMHNGTIVEQGTFEELLNNKSFYYELYNSQFS